MTSQHTTSLQTPVTLTDDEQKKLINYVLDCDQKGRKARAKYESDWKDCWKAYHCVSDPIVDEEMEWQSNLCLPWAYDAVESWYAYMHSSLMPKDDEIFSISGVTRDDDPGAEVMEQYLEYRFTKNKFPERLGKSLKQLAIWNHSCIKTYWRKDQKISYAYEPSNTLNPLTGEIVQGYQLNTNASTDYNNVCVDVVDIDNISFYPIFGDFEKTTRVHTTYRYYEELMMAAQSGEAPYFNLDKIRLDDEKKPYAPDGTPVSEYVGSDWSLNDTEKDRQSSGLRIKEAWIYRCRIGDKVYRNYIATIVNDRWLIRFEPNTLPEGKSPFLWLAFNPDGDCLYGYGLLSKGLPILRAANRKFNMRQDELNLKLYGSYKYWDDNVFNPYAVVSQPGAMIQMADAQSCEANLVPLNPHLEHIQLTYEEIAALLVEFEEVTVPKVVKGMLEARDATATEITATDNKASGKMNVQAFHINDRLLQPFIEQFYLLTYEALHEDPSVLLEIARLTQPASYMLTTDINGNPLPPNQQQEILYTDQQLIAMLPKFLPLPEIDVKIVAYENFLRKQQVLQNLAALLPQAAQSPGAKYIKWYNTMQLTARLMSLPKDEVIMNADERDQADQQEQAAQQQQQQMAMAPEMAKMQLESAKLQLEATKENNRHQETMLQMQLENARLNLDAQNAAVNAMLGQQEIEAKKEKANEPEPKSAA